MPVARPGAASARGSAATSSRCSGAAKGKSHAFIGFRGGNRQKAGGGAGLAEREASCVCVQGMEARGAAGAKWGAPATGFHPIRRYEAPCSHFALALCSRRNGGQASRGGRGGTDEARRRVSIPPPRLSLPQRAQAHEGIGACSCVPRRRGRAPARSADPGRRAHDSCSGVPGEPVQDPLVQRELRRQVRGRPAVRESRRLQASEKRAPRAMRSARRPSARSRRGRAGAGVRRGPGGRRPGARRAGACR
jgi:hypothetical protein